MKYNGGGLRNEEIRSIFEVRIALDTLVVRLCLSTIREEEIELLYQSNYKMWTYIRDKDVEGAVEWIENSMRNCIEGDQQIYYE